MQPKLYHTIGRSSYINMLNNALDSNRSEFIAVYGRRRVGKTHLIQSVVSRINCIYLHVTGVYKEKNQNQLKLFQREIENKFFNGNKIPDFKNWREGFEQLSIGLSVAGENKKIVIFFDELPWLAGHKTDLISSLDYFWNTKFQYLQNIKLIVCGSAAHWMLSKLIRAKGGLHNRLTLSLRVDPLTLKETKQYLNTRGVAYQESHVIEVFMATGGIPYYLNFIDSNLSSMQNIAKIYFGEAAPLREEFNVIFEALFGQNTLHRRIVKTLSKKGIGLNRKEIIKALKLASGGSLTKSLDELEEAGFIKKITPFKKAKSSFLYRLVDPFCIFWLEWADYFEKMGLGDPIKFWISTRQSQRFKVWSGYTFEGICFNLSEEIKKILGFQDVNSWAGPAVITDSGGNKAQIDLLFDRSDGVITVIEIKYHEGKFMIDGKIADDISRKLEILGRVFPKKIIQMALLTKDGYVGNKFSNELNIKFLSSTELF